MEENLDAAPQITRIMPPAPLGPTLGSPQIPHPPESIHPDVVLAPNLAGTTMVTVYLLPSGAGTPTKMQFASPTQYKVLTLPSPPFLRVGSASIFSDIPLSQIALVNTVITP